MDAIFVEQKEHGSGDIAHRGAEDERRLGL